MLIHRPRNYITLGRPFKRTTMHAHAEFARGSDSRVSAASVHIGHREARIAVYMYSCPDNPLGSVKIKG